MPDRLQEYLTQVGEQIRWKRARPRLLAELESHLLDQRDDCLSQGMTEEEAQQEAVRQMGDPVQIGQSLDEVHRPRPQWSLLAAVLVLAGAGAALRLSLTAGWVRGGSSGAETITMLCLGAAALVGAYLLDYTWLCRRGIVVGSAGLGVVWAVGIWMQRHPFEGQWDLLLTAGNVLVFCLPLLFVLWVLPWRGKGGKGLLAAFLYLGALLVGLLWSFQTVGMVFTAVICSGLLLLLAGKDWFGWGRKRTLVCILAVAALFLAALGFVFVRYAYARERLALLLDPAQDPVGAGYPWIMLQQALQGAQWSGPGMWGAEIPYEVAVPDAGGAYFLVTVVTKLGWLPAVGILAALGGLLVWLLVRSLAQKNQVGRLVALAVLGTMLLRLLVGTWTLVLGLPQGWASGVPLFFTDGGAVADLALLGFVLSVFRQETLPMPGISRSRVELSS